MQVKTEQMTSETNVRKKILSLCNGYSISDDIRDLKIGDIGEVEEYNEN